MQLNWISIRVRRAHTDGLLRCCGAHHCLFTLNGLSLCSAGRWCTSWNILHISLCLIWLSTSGFRQQPLKLNCSDLNNLLSSLCSLCVIWVFIFSFFNCWMQQKMYCQISNETMIQWFKWDVYHPAVTIKAAAEQNRENLLPIFQHKKCIQ